MVAVVKFAVEDLHHATIGAGRPAMMDQLVVFATRSVMSNAATLDAQ